MSGEVGVRINTEQLERKLAKLAILQQQGLLSSLELGARRFVQLAVRNTMPMILSQSPANVRRAWNAKIEAYFTAHRVTKDGYRKDAELKKLLAGKKRQLGREAGGWNAAAVKLKARVPAWVRRHGTSEGSCTIVVRNGKATIRMANRVPYNQEMTLKRAQYVLASVARGIDGNLRALKRKIVKSVS